MARDFEERVFSQGYRLMTELHVQQFNHSTKPHTRELVHVFKGALAAFQCKRDEATVFRVLEYIT